MKIAELLGGLIVFGACLVAVCIYWARIIDDALEGQGQNKEPWEWWV